MKMENLNYDAISAWWNWKPLFFLPVVWSLLSLATIRLERASFRLLYPVGLLSLLPVWLVEPRYYLIPFVLFLAFRQRMPVWVALATTCLGAAAAGFIFYGTASGWFFP